MIEVYQPSMRNRTKLRTRLVTIAGKLTRMLVLLVLIRCFGADMAACMLAAMQSGRRVMSERFRTAAAKYGYGNDIARTGRIDPNFK